MSKFPLLSRPQQRKTMTPAALAANKANAQKAGRPKGKISLSDISFRDRCRVRDEEHIAILEHIARYSENEGFRLAAIRDLFDRGRGRPRQAIEGSGPGGAIPFSVVLPAAFRLSAAVSGLTTILACAFTAASQGAPFRRSSMEKCEIDHIEPAQNSMDDRPQDRVVRGI